MGGGSLRRVEKAGIKPGKGVRQGMPLSPFFANLFLKEFDAAVERKDYQMVRYADDLIFLADSQDDCLRIHEFVSKELEKLGLSIPAIDRGNIDRGSKTRIFEPGDPAEFLGVELRKNDNGYVLEVPEKKIRSTVGLITSEFSPTNVERQGITLPRVIAKLDTIVDG